MKKIKAITIAENESFLRQISQEVNLNDSELQENIKSLEKYCMENEVMAMASIQIGIPKRLIYLKNTNLERINRLQTNSDEIQDKDYNEAQVLINPIIKEAYGLTEYWEACASCLDNVGKVKRPYQMTVEYLNELGEKIVKKFEGFEATVLSHEIDHLNGILHIDIAEELLHLSVEERKKFRQIHNYKILRKTGLYLENNLQKIEQLPIKERRNIPYQELIKMMSQLSPDEIIKLSNLIGYPVFTRMCMGCLKHKFVLLQDGAAAIILNNKNQVLLQRRADNDSWGLPGGCQELGKTLEETVIREVKEETNLDVLEKDLQLISIVSGMSRRNFYPNGDVVINNTALYSIKNYTGNLLWDNESKELNFFDLDNLPEKQNDSDLIKIYKKTKQSQD